MLPIEYPIDERIILRVIGNLKLNSPPTLDGSALVGIRHFSLIQDAY
jgi:hypothetical protein